MHFFVPEIIITVKKSHYSMAVEGEKFENDNLMAAYQSFKTG